MDNTLHHHIEELGILRNAKKQLDYEAKQMAARVETKERTIMELMDNQQLTESGSAAGRVTLGEAVYPHVENWDEFYNWIFENRFVEFLERRPTALAYREAIEKGIRVPGVVPFTKRKLTFRET